MKLLAFESSAKAAGVAVLDDGRLLAEYFQNSGQTHSRTLMQMAEDLLITAISRRRILAPAPWQTDRAALPACASAWQRQRACLGAGDSVLRRVDAGGDGRARGMFGRRHLLRMDARRAQVYNAVFERCGETLVRLREDRAISLDDLCEDLQNIEKTIFLVGDGAELCYTTLLERLPRLTLLPDIFVSSAHPARRLRRGRKSAEANAATREA